MRYSILGFVDANYHSSGEKAHVWKEASYSGPVSALAFHPLEHAVVVAGGEPLSKVDKMSLNIIKYYSSILFKYTRWWCSPGTRPAPSCWRRWSSRWSNLCFNLFQLFHQVVQVTLKLCFKTCSHLFKQQIVQVTPKLFFEFVINFFTSKWFKWPQNFVLTLSQHFHQQVVQVTLNLGFYFFLSNFSK